MNPKIIILNISFVFEKLIIILCLTWITLRWILGYATVNLIWPSSSCDHIRVVYLVVTQILVAICHGFCRIQTDTSATSTICGGHNCLLNSCFHLMTTLGWARTWERTRSRWRSWSRSRSRSRPRRVGSRPRHGRVGFGVRCCFIRHCLIRLFRFCHGWWNRSFRVDVVCFDRRWKKIKIKSVRHYFLIQLTGPFSMFDYNL